MIHKESWYRESIERGLERGLEEAWRAFRRNPSLGTAIPVIKETLRAGQKLPIEFWEIVHEQNLWDRLPEEASSLSPTIEVIVQEEKWAGLPVNDHIGGGFHWQLPTPVDLEPIEFDYAEGETRIKTNLFELYNNLEQWDTDADIEYSKETSGHIEIVLQITYAKVEISRLYGSYVGLPLHDLTVTHHFDLFLYPEEPRAETLRLIEHMVRSTWQ